MLFYHYTIETLPIECFLYFAPMPETSLQQKKKDCLK